MVTVEIPSIISRSLFAAPSSPEGPVINGAVSSILLIVIIVAVVAEPPVPVALTSTLYSLLFTAVIGYTIIEGAL